LRINASTEGRHPEHDLNSNSPNLNAVGVGGDFGKRRQAGVMLPTTGTAVLNGYPVP